MKTGLIEQKGTDVATRDVSHVTTRPDFIHVRNSIVQDVAIVLADDEQCVRQVGFHGTRVIVQRGEFVHEKTHHVFDRIDDERWTVLCLPLIAQLVVECSIRLILVELLFEKRPGNRSRENTITEDGRTS